MNLSSNTKFNQDDATFKHTVTNNQCIPDELLAKAFKL